MGNKIYYNLPGFQKSASAQIMQLIPGIPQPAAVGLATLGAGLQTVGAFAICLDVCTVPLSAASVVFYGVAGLKVQSQQGANALLWMKDDSDNAGKFRSVKYLTFGPGVYMAGYAFLFAHSVTKKPHKAT